MLTVVFLPSRGPRGDQCLPARPPVQCHAGTAPGGPAASSPQKSLAPARRAPGDAPRHCALVPLSCPRGSGGRGAGPGAAPAPSPEWVTVGEVAAGDPAECAPGSSCPSVTGPGCPCRWWAPAALCPLPRRQPPRLALPSSARSAPGGHKAPRPAPSRQPPRPMSPCYRLPVSCRSAGRRPLPAAVLAPRGLLVVGGGRGGAAARGRGSPARQSAVLRCRGCRLLLGPGPAPPLRVLLPVSTSRHVLKPKVTGMNAWLPPLAPLPGGPFTPTPRSPRRVRARRPSAPLLPGSRSPR
uniref:Uncharacterized protein n=1 Tax=Pipistrellus kuhlii TaxID=59472 RepID=A0A7J7R802_PIPKU|nr:hypothetical protein mPipKuh1_010833 [Pipistrellus kuhlii]